jgi:hypothetical protein
MKIREQIIRLIARRICAVLRRLGHWPKLVFQRTETAGLN